jgi:hypothetical protein
MGPDFTSVLRSRALWAESKRFVFAHLFLGMIGKFERLFVVLAVVITNTTEEPTST